MTETTKPAEIKDQIKTATEAPEQPQDKLSTDPAEDKPAQSESDKKKRNRGAQMLNDNKIKSLIKTAQEDKTWPLNGRRFYDGTTGLNIKIYSSGVAYWLFRFQTEAIRDGELKVVRPEISFGTYGHRAGQVSLAQAREKAEAARVGLREGIKPLGTYGAVRVKRQERAEKKTFRKISEEWLETWKTGNVKSTIDKKIRHLKNFLYPKIGGLLLSEISFSHLDELRIDYLNKGGKWTRNCQLDKLIDILSQIAEYAKINGIQGYITLDEHIANFRRIYKNREKTTHHKTVLQYDGIQNIIKTVDSTNKAGIISDQVAIYYTVLMLVFCRPGELIQGKFADIDKKAKIWYQPDQEKSTKRKAIIPLSDKAFSLLMSLRTSEEDEGFFFKSPKKSPKFEGKHLSKSVVEKALKKIGLGEKQSLHGFRRTANIILKQKGFSQEYRDAQLAHVQNKVDESYDDMDAHIEARQKMLNYWTLALKAIEDGADELPDPKPFKV